MENKIVEVTFSPKEAFDEEVFNQKILLYTKGKPFKILKRSIDARKVEVKVHFQIELVNDKESKPDLWKPDFKPLTDDKRAIIIGFGPAGMFAAITCLENGIKPIILERGKDVRERRRDLALLTKEMIVNEDSNYCFGEGGAGTYSDGKLYTRATKRGNVKRILEILHYHGAREEILYDAHPHIGTNKLPSVVTKIRETIENGGGEVHFNLRVTDFKIEKNKIRGVVLANGETVEGDHFILATGHSARDIYKLLNDKKIQIEAKPYALGVRIEHPQQVIDQIQYHCIGERSEWLPASSYSLKHQASNNRGVFSFCMCPGGFIVPAATSPGEIVVNGMSPSKRNSFFANSGTVVTVDQRDFKKYEKYGSLAGMYFQQEVEQKACQIAGNTQVAPAQRLTDFMNNKISGSLPPTSYIPGLQSVDMKELLPEGIYTALKEGVKAFGKKMKGYYTEEAQLVGVESRTSAPVRIPRDNEKLHHPQIINLFPCGEGAGYAGGIVSAAIDGTRCADALI
ncbi:MAG: FAD-binding protein [Cyclobacteriaceae bacterium]|nr:FAD-binding protein [Cyclobacteriaceae bacterium]